MTGISTFVLRHKKLVGLIWLVLFLAGGATSSKLSGRLSHEFNFPNTASYQANQAIETQYRTGGAQYPLVPVVVLPTGTSATDPAVDAQLTTAFTAGAKIQPGARVVSYGDTHDARFVGTDGRTTFGLIYLQPNGGVAGPDLGPQVAALMKPDLPAGSTVNVTGMTELTAGNNGGAGLSILAETIIGGLGALLVLAFVFGSFLALLPLIVAVVSIMTTFLAVYLLSYSMSVSFIVQFLIGLVGLGVAIDYSLLISTRWREELAAGYTGDEAVTRALASAGRAVAFSGLTVAVGLLSLLLVPVPFLRSTGLGGMFIALISTLVAITLLPILLSTIGPKLNWPRLRDGGKVSKGWTRWAGLVVRSRWASAAVALAILGVLAASAFSIKLGDPTSASLQASATSQASTGLAQLQSNGIPSGVFTSMDVVVDSGDPSAAQSALAAVPGVFGVAAPQTAAWRHGNTSLIEVMPADEGSTSAGADTIGRLRTEATKLGGVMIGGEGPEIIDSDNAIYGPFPYVLALVSVITFLLLARAFRSLILPLQAVVLNLISLAATLGVTVLVWQFGHGSDTFWNIHATGAITGWIPLMVFAFLFGLSMDYEVFILSRVREEYDESGNTNWAVAAGIGRTGRLVTSAALILFLAFLSLSTAPAAPVKILATGLGAGILLDATVIRSLLVPAAVSLIGRWNWYLPAWLAKPLRVEPSAAVRESAFPAVPLPTSGGSGTPQKTSEVTR